MQTFGRKQIGFGGSFVILVVSMNGPPLIKLPILFQETGWLLPILAFILFGGLSVLASCFLCEAMACVPGNHHFQGRVEYTTLARFFFGKTGHILSQIFVNGTLVVINVASILVVVEVMDTLLLKLFEGTCGISLYPEVSTFCKKETVLGLPPFEEYIMLGSTGYVVALLIIIPISYLTLEESIRFQMISLIFLIVTVLVWCIGFEIRGLDSNRIQLIGTNHLNFIISYVMFNFSFVVLVPSWVNEKAADVKITSTIVTAVIFSLIICAAVGIVGAAAFDFELDSNLLIEVNTFGNTVIFMKVLTYAFPIFMFSFSVGVNSIVIKYNLSQNEVCGPFLNFFISSVLQWLLVIPSSGKFGIDVVIIWGGIFFISIANFIFPFLIYVKATRFRAFCPRLSGDQALIDNGIQMTVRSVRSEQASSESSSLLPKSTPPYTLFSSRSVVPTKTFAIALTVIACAFIIFALITQTVHLVAG